MDGVLYFKYHFENSKGKVLCHGSRKPGEILEDLSPAVFAKCCLVGIPVLAVILGFSRIWGKMAILVHGNY